MASDQIARGLSKSNAIKYSAANIKDMVFKETLSNNDTLHTIEFTNGITYDLLTHAGKSDYDLAKDNGFTGTLEEWLTSLDSCLGEFENYATLITKYPIVSVGIYPNGVNSHKFAIINDVNGTGVVSIAFYNPTSAKWNVTKLNQAIPVGEPKNLCRL